MKLFRFLPAAAWFTLSFYLFTLPGNRLPKYNWFDRIHGDKFVHAGIFAVLVCLVVVAAAPAGIKILKTTLAIALAAVCYGIAIELIQKYFVPFRSFELADIAADSIGSFLPYFVLLARIKQVANQ